MGPEQALATDRVIQLLKRYVRSPESFVTVLIMDNEASLRLKRLNNKIMQTWENRALKEVNASIHQDSLALRDSLPEFLGQIASALSTTIDRTETRVKWELQESTRVGKKHGRERAGSVNYTMDQLIFEYHILRQVICEVMEEEAILTPIEREVIVCAVEQAVNDAATEYSETLRNIQETFTHTLAHDLRGPITAAKLSSQLLLKFPNDSENSLKIVARISSSMDRLDYMINDLLDVSRLKAGEEISLQLAPCDLDLLISEIADEENFLHGNRIKLDSCGSLIGFWCWKSLRRVVDNLVHNALKYSQPKSPIVIKLIKLGGNAEVSVFNIGNPIAPEDLAILFQQYRRVQTGVTKIGWGLGLTVVKGITEAHSGTVHVESSEAGTTFTVKLPLKAHA
ncbi:MAG TPA: HAMP domain-containing sensor histidine kinase [Bacteriovoracaceae bacterium]|nr:HAMP domain-containing sensor histidine kinase [Bacteriovoracaceae bacterium]